jgi:uncharacterized protein
MNGIEVRIPMARCEWRSLVFLNYAVEALRLRPFLPPSLELDLWEGKPWISLVGLTFKHTKVLGIPVPFEQDYEQINLRFYVKRRIEGRVRRGVVFLREIVPKPFLAMSARLLLNEKYTSRRTGRTISKEADGPCRARYEWRGASPGVNFIEATTGGAPFLPGPRSHEVFLSKRLWSYTPQRDGSVSELRVGHPAWEVSAVSDSGVALAEPGVFPRPFHDVLKRKPDTSFLAEGSRVTLYLPGRISAKPLAA